MCFLNKNEVISVTDFCTSGHLFGISGVFLGLYYWNSINFLIIIKIKCDIIRIKLVVYMY